MRCKAMKQVLENVFAAVMAVSYIGSLAGHMYRLAEEEKASQQDLPLQAAPPLPK